jgi:hypothetical protein
MARKDGTVTLLLNSDNDFLHARAYGLPSSPSPRRTVREVEKSAAAATKWLSSTYGALPIMVWRYAPR